MRREENIHICNIYIVCKYEHKKSKPLNVKLSKMSQCVLERYSKSLLKQYRYDIFDIHVFF